MNSKTLFRRMRKSPLFVAGGIMLIAMVILCATAPLWTYWNPEAADIMMRNSAPDWFANGLKGHPFGTDPLGRDILSRLFAGGWNSLKISFVATLISFILGCVVGLTTAYFGGAVDMIIMRLCDVLAAIPQLMLGLCIVSIIGPSMGAMYFTLSVSGWIGGARLVRSVILSIKNKEFVQASKVLGASTTRILWKELFPNTITQMMIESSAHFGGTILVETSLSYLGMGVPVPTPSWGNMIADGRNYISNAPWIIIIPGIALMITVLGFNFMGDGLRDVLDPKNTN